MFLYLCSFILTNNYTPYYIQNTIFIFLIVSNFLINNEQRLKSYYYSDSFWQADFDNISK